VTDNVDCLVIIVINNKIAVVRFEINPFYYNHFALHSSLISVIQTSL